MSRFQPTVSEFEPFDLRQLNRALPLVRGNTTVTNSTGLSVGSPRENPSFQSEATTYFRIFAQASTPEPLAALKLLLADETMQHFSGTV